MNNKDVLLRSTFLGPSILVSKGIAPIIVVLDRLISEEQGNESDETVTTLTLRKYKLFTASELFRETLDKEFPSWEVEATMKPLISKEVCLWERVLKLLEQMEALHLLTGETANAFDALIQERALMVFIATSSKNGSAATQHIKSLQSQNRKLEGCENPFIQEKESFTWGVIDQATTLAEQSDSFRRDYYMPLVRARQSLVAYLKEERARSYVNGKIQRQGRKKRATAKTTSH